MKQLHCFLLLLLLLFVFSCSDEKNDPICKLSVDTSELSFTNETGGEETLFFNILADPEVEWKIECDNTPWASLDIIKGKGSSQINITTESNKSEKERQSQLIIKTTKYNIESKNITIKITQDSKNSIINILDYIEDVSFKEYLIGNLFNRKTFVTKAEAKAVNSIDVAINTISSLKGIELFTNLEHLFCSDTSITDLDLSSNTNLKRLYCYDIPLASLNILKNIKLEELDCFNTNLSTLDVSRNVKLRILHCDMTPLSMLNISNNEELEILNCSETNLSNLDLLKNTKLEYLFIENQKLTAGSVKIYRSTLANIKIDVEKNDPRLYIIDDKNTTK